MNLNGVSRSARPTSRLAPKAHCVMGKTQKGHCKRSFGTNVLVSVKRRDNFLSPSQPLKKDVNKNIVIEQLLNLKLCSRTRPCHERDHFSSRHRSLRMGFSLGELGGDASSTSSACDAFRDWGASAKPVLILTEEISSTFVPRYFAVLYLISRSGTKPQSPPNCSQGWQSHVHIFFVKSKKLFHLETAVLLLVLAYQVSRI